ncbi:MAG: PspC domain-containing protein [Bacteroidales bacterium]|nr:PspC domain-containing protein [Bacteroidales bacterium]
MKQTYSINLAGMVFNIDDDAYFELKDYLHQIETHFANAEERREIIADIESRIAELFNEMVKGSKQVIDLENVRKIKSILGDPVEIADPEAETSGSPQREKFRSTGYRRIYRDPEHRYLGGVCSGMGAYWQIDPLVFRIIFLIAFFGFGVGLIIYIILWIVIPEAKTAAQKLEMKGEPVNISNIGKTVKEEFNNVRDRMKI